jgi:hypothetical protein
VYCWFTRLVLRLKPGHACDPIAHLSGVQLPLTVATINPNPNPNPAGATGASAAAINGRYSRCALVRGGRSVYYKQATRVHARVELEQPGAAEGGSAIVIEQLTRCGGAPLLSLVANPT